MEQKQLTRKEYIESELNKWKERYEIGFEEEFDLEVMFSLQHQLMITPPEHVKTIGDIIHTKNQIMKNLSLRPKYTLSFSSEIWFVDLERIYESIEENKFKYKLRLVKMNQSKGKTNVVSIDRIKDTTFKELANLLLVCILEGKPCKIFVDKMGVGMGLFDSLKEIINMNRKVLIKDNGELAYFNE